MANGCLFGDLRSFSGNFRQFRQGKHCLNDILIENTLPRGKNKYKIVEVVDYNHRSTTNVFETFANNNQDCQSGSPFTYFGAIFLSLNMRRYP